MSEFGSEVRRLRLQRGMSLRTLATEAGLSHVYLWQIERGDKPGSAYVQSRLDKALDADGALLGCGLRTRPEVVGVALTRRRGELLLGHSRTLGDDVMDVPTAPTDSSGERATASAVARTAGWRALDLAWMWRIDTGDSCVHLYCAHRLHPASADGAADQQGGPGIRQPAWVGMPDALRYLADGRLAATAAAAVAHLYAV